MSYKRRKLNAVFKQSGIGSHPKSWIN